MWSKIKKWWNREWSNWESLDVINTYNKFGGLIGKNEILKRTSNDGLVEYKKLEIF